MSEGIGQNRITGNMRLTPSQLLDKFGARFAQLVSLSKRPLTSLTSHELVAILRVGAERDQQPFDERDTLFKPDLLFEIPDPPAFAMLYDLIRDEGLSLGSSSAINVAGAVEVAKHLGPGHTVVTIFCDAGSRYASKIYNPAYLATRGLQAPAWLTASAPAAQQPTASSSRDNSLASLFDWSILIDACVMK